MVSQIGSAASSSMQFIPEIFQKLGAADVDGKSGLSKSELSTINAGTNAEDTSFLETLSEKFDELDTNKDGQLSAEEIATAMPQEPMGAPPGFELEASKETQAIGASEAEKSSTEELLEKIKEALVNSFADSYAKNDSDEDAKTISSLLESANTDGIEGLSLDELKAAGESGSSGNSKIIQKLMDNFSAYDADGDGQLSKKEMLAALPKQFSRQEMAEMSESKNVLGAIGSALEKSSGAMVQKLINSYQNGDLSKLASTLNFAI